MTTNDVKQAIESIRADIDLADTAKNEYQIGRILIALSRLVDVVEALAEKQTEAPQGDPYARARHEYQAERRIDEWAAYHAQEDE